LIVEQPEDPALISLLLTSYLEAQDATGAERATSLLMKHDAAHYTRFSGSGATAFERRRY